MGRRCRRGTAAPVSEMKISTSADRRVSGGESAEGGRGEKEKVEGRGERGEGRGERREGRGERGEGRGERVR